MRFCSLGLGANAEMYCARAEWQLMQLNGGYGDYTGWYFNANGGLTLNSSMFSGWLGEYLLPPLPPCSETLCFARSSI